MIILPYKLDAVILHMFFSFSLFFIVNWLGKQSLSFGYMQLSPFYKSDEAPAFNFLFRVISPTVYIVILSTILYYCNLDGYVKNIYLVNIYYFVFRISFNVTLNRTRLINWKEQVILFISVSLISYITYIKIIEIRKNILPDFNTISNELWIIIAIFIYQLFNKIRLPTSSTKERKLNYIMSQYQKYFEKYDDLISGILKNKKLEAISYSILIYEDFNRPKIIRIIENLLFRLGRAKSLGIMQVKTDRLISDDESVELGTKRILNDYIAIKDSDDTEGANRNEYVITRKLIVNYNPDERYFSEVNKILSILYEGPYKGSHEKLGIVRS